MKKTIEKKMWVVVAFGMDYNDEIYSQSQYTDPVEIFDNKDDANKRCDELNILELRGKDLMDYGYDPNDFAEDVEGVKQWFRDHKLDPDTSMCISSDKKKITDKDLIELYNMLYIQFHSVREVPYIEIVKLKPKAQKDASRFAKFGKENE